MWRQRVLSLFREQARAMWRSRRRRAALAAVFLLLLGSLGVGAMFHQRQQADMDVEETGEIEMEVDASAAFEGPPAPVAPPPPPDQEARADAARADTAARAQPISPPREVKAAWYDVPEESLAKRRAGGAELTAAHNRLPIGTLVRVTHLENGRSTLVRITDRGIRDRKIKLDVCREAAEELGMLNKGVARVKMEIMREEPGPAPPESHNASPQP